MSEDKKKNRKFGRHGAVRLLALAVAVIMLMMTLSMTAFAEMDLSPGSCKLKLELPERSTYEDPEYENISVITDLYRIGNVRTYGKAKDYYKASLNEDFDGLMGFSTGDVLEIEDWETAAQKAAAIVRDGSIEPERHETNEDNIVKFEELDPGLYLVITHGDYGDSKEYFKEIGDKLVTIAETKEWEYQFTPSLVAVPYKKLTDGRFDVLDEGDWLYDLTSFIKADWEEKTGAIRITKELIGYNPEYTATFVFDVTVTSDKDLNGDGELNDIVFSQVYTLDFKDCGKKTITIDNLPLRSTVTVEEVYNGAGYKLVDQVKPEDPTVKVDEIIEFSFKNDYTKTDVGGYGILNEFTYNGPDEDWGWDNSHDSSDPSTD